MNEDTLKGQWTQLQGAVRAQWGKLSNDDVDQIQGQTEQLVGKIQERPGSAVRIRVDHRAKTLRVTRSITLHIERDALSNPRTRRSELVDSLAVSRACSETSDTDARSSERGRTRLRLPVHGCDIEIEISSAGVGICKGNRETMRTGGERYRPAV